MRLIIFLILPWIVWAKGNSACEVALDISGVKEGGIPVHYRVGICEKKNNLMLGEVSVPSLPMRTISLPMERYRSITFGVQSTLKDVEAMTSPISPCRHKIDVRLNWEGAKKNFSSCDSDKLSLLVLKLSQIAENLYLEK